ncbi:MAG: ABC transporter permease, partial [Acidobacteriota bacterium]
MRLSPLNRKLFRELIRMRGQALAIALVIGAGVAMNVLMLSTFYSLELTQQTYYDRYRFAEVFASLKRAPQRVETDIAQIPGVARAETRVVVDVTLDVEGMSEPAIGRLISIPEVDRRTLCDVYLRRGRYIEVGHPDEILASETFALAHGLEPGDTLTAIINGHRRELEIVGLALSPEYVYTIRPGELLPDEKRFGIFWMERRALGAAFDMEGGFNDVVLDLMPEASIEEVIDRLDEILKPYGGLGALPRSLQPSHWYLANELRSLRGMGAIIPIIFLAVAAFLLNVVLSRIVLVQREEIAVIKAVGYANRAIAMHYLKFSLLIALIGVALGLVFGAWLGRGMTEMYTDFFDFPILEYQLPWDVVLEAMALSLVAAGFGAISAVRKAVQLPPAEAMRPEPPAVYHVTWIERSGLRRWLSQPARIIVRNLRRYPGRALASIIGIAASVGLLILGTFSSDSVDRMIDLQFYFAQRYDLMVSFVEPASPSAYYELSRKPGVLAVEPFRSTPVRIRSGPIHRQTAITGIPTEARLNRLVDASEQVVTLPPEGLVLSAKLAEILGTEPGKLVTVEVLEGRRPVLEVPVSRVVTEFMGTNAYMDLDALRRILGEDATLSGAYLTVDGAAVQRLYSDLKSTPKVAGVMLQSASLESFDQTM